MNTIEHTPNSSRSYAIIITGSFLFCAKGILVKELFRYGFSAQEALTLRMLFALPFYLVAGLWLRTSLRKVSKRDFVWIMVLSFIGFYICSLVNFTGLQHVSVGLERIILFSYPSLVLIGGVLFQKKKHGIKQYLACVLTWIGLALVVLDEVKISGENNRILFGAMMIFLSALIYASYLLIAKPLIHRVGALNTTTLGMVFCCTLILTVQLIKNGTEMSGTYSPQSIALAIAIGTLGTVAPTYLLSLGLSRVSSSSYAIVSSLGPIITIIVATCVTQQIPTAIQITGMSLALISSTFTNLKS